MKLSKMNAFLGTVALVCACNAPGSNHGQLVANSDAQHAGVYAYAVEDGIVTMFDRDGIELGRVSVTTPSPDQRYFKAEMTDGTEDQVEVYRPMAERPLHRTAGTRNGADRDPHRSRVARRMGKVRRDLHGGPQPPLRGRRARAERH